MDIQCIAPRFDLLEHSQKTVSIQVSPDGFCFCIKNSETPGEIITFYQYIPEISSGGSPSVSLLAEALRKVFQEEPLLQIQIEKQEGHFSGTRSTLIPESLFDSEQIGLYGEKAFGPLPSGWEYQADLISALKAIHLYPCPAVFPEVLREKFPSLEFSHALTPWIEHILVVSAQHPALRFYVSVADTQATLAATQQGSLLFFNRFDIESTDGLLYYLLSVAATFEKSPKEISLMLYPETTEEISLTDLLEFFPAEIVKTDTPEFLKEQNLRPFLHLLKNYL